MNLVQTLFFFFFFSFQLLRFSPESRPCAGSRDGWMQVRLRFYQLTTTSHSPVNHNRHSECLHSWPGPSRAGTCKPDYHLIITCTQTFHVLKRFSQLKPDSETCFPHVSCYCGKIYSAVWIKKFGCFTRVRGSFQSGSFALWLQSKTMWWREIF